MRDHDLWGNAPGNNPPTLLCSVDPITMGAMALGGIIPGLLGGNQSSSAPAPAPAPPPSAPPPQQQPVGSKNQNKAQAPTFLGASATPAPTQSSQKTLLGQ
jgi:hypothetical protein